MFLIVGKPKITKKSRVLLLDEVSELRKVGAIVWHIVGKMNVAFHFHLDHEVLSVLVPSPIWPVQNKQMVSHVGTEVPNGGLGGWDICIVVCLDKEVLDLEASRLHFLHESRHDGQLVDVGVQFDKHKIPIKIVEDIRKLHGGSAVPPLVCVGGSASAFDGQKVLGIRILVLVTQGEVLERPERLAVLSCDSWTDGPTWLDGPPVGQPGDLKQDMKSGLHLIAGHIAPHGCCERHCLSDVRPAVEHLLMPCRTFSSEGLSIDLFGMPLVPIQLVHQPC
mmetsp:Transcript_31745/g.61956  ORF Transcript_31745/g.61956 Transcript_31745/m.61956 type:complete len:278 (+) Transcript_31745:325-1158(+)